MAEGRRRDEYERWTPLVLIMANAHRDTKERSQPYRPEDYNPFAKPAGKPAKLPMSAMKEAFLNRHPEDKTKQL